MRLAIVGVGKVASKNYLPVLAARPGVELGYVSRNREAGERAVEAHGGTVVDSIEELAQWHPDVVFILSADVAHSDHLRRVVELGLPRVFIEKPLVADEGQAHVSVDDFLLARDVVHSADERGVGIAMNFNYRYFELVQTALRLARERNFGAVTGISAWSHYACWSHVIDLIGHFAGPIHSLSALSSTTERSGVGLIARDLAITFRSTDGVVGTLLGSAGLAWQHPLLELTIHYERGTLALKDLGGELLVSDAATGWSETIRFTADESRWERYSASFAASITAYLDAIEGDRPVPIDVDAGLRELQFEAAVRLSVREGTSIVLANRLPLQRESTLESENV